MLHDTEARPPPSIAGVPRLNIWSLCSHSGEGRTTQASRDMTEVDRDGLEKQDASLASQQEMQGQKLVHFATAGGPQTLT